MNEENRSDTQNIAGDLSALTAAIRSRRMVTTWVLVIVYAVIAIYLGVIYAKFKPHMEPEALATYAMVEAQDRLPDLKVKATDYLTGHVPAAADMLEQELANLPSYREDLAKLLKEQAPALVGQLDIQQLKSDIPGHRAKLAETLKAKAPELIGQIDVQDLKKQITSYREELTKKLTEDAPGYVDQIDLEQLKTKIPKYRQDLTKALTSNAPKLVNQLRDKLLASLPQLQSSLVGLAKDKLGETTPELQKLIDDAVKNIVDQHVQDIQALEGSNLPEGLTASFEEAAGPVLDKYTEGVGIAIKDIRANMEDLLAKQAAGTLTKEEKVKLRYIQLWKTYWNVRMPELQTTTIKSDAAPE